jgi:hypothetical protein
MIRLMTARTNTRSTRNTYNEDSIRILSTEEATARFEWAKVARRSAEFTRPEEWVARGVRACLTVGVDPEYFHQRYLAKPQEVRDAIAAANTARLNAKRFIPTAGLCAS